MMGMLTVALHAVVDTAFIGRLGTEPLAALGLANIYFFTGFVLLLGLMRNSIAFTARAFGADRWERIGEILAHYQWLALLGFPALWVFMLGFPWVAGLAGLSEGVTGQAEVYLAVRVWGVPFSLTLVLYSAFFQSIGNSRLPMAIGWATVGINVVLDYGLIFGRLGLPALGIRGSALATVIAEAAGAALMVALAYRPSLQARFRLRFLVPPRWNQLGPILRVGLPQGLGDFTEIAFFLAFFAIVGRLGEVPLAANNIAIQVTHLLYLPGVATGIAAGAYMGRFLGAGDPDVAQAAARRTLRVGLAYMGLMGLPLWFFGGPIAGLFSEDPRVIRQAALLLKLMALYQVFDGLGIILRGALSGAGDTRFSLLVLLGVGSTVMLPTAWLLAGWIEPPLLGAWLGVFAHFVVLGLVLYWRFRQGSWRNAGVEVR